MTDRDFELTRRKALAGLATVGAAGAGAGLGTSALFNDTESFLNNSVQAGTLDLVVDYYTSTDQGSFGTSSQSGEVNGDGATVYDYTVSDVKPGDSGTLAFCPKIVTNRGWLWVGSAGVTDYENGQTEPEGGVDATPGGSMNGTNDGADAGDLSCAMDVTVSYAESASLDGDQVECSNTRELNNPADYTLADLSKDLETGFPLDGDEPGNDDGTVTPYPGSSGADDQQGPCLCIEWEVPTDVGNEIQSDAIEFGFQFVAEQARNNPDPANPFVDAIVTSGSIQDAIDAASAGDVIMVKPGTYAEQVTVDVPDLLLFSRDPAATTITDQVVVSADGATLCGFTVSPPAPTSNGTGEALRISDSPDGVSIYNNIVEDIDGSNLPTWEGMDAIVAFGGSASDPIENLTIANNTARRIQGRNTQGGAAGISIQGNVDGATVKNNTVTEIGQETTSWAFGTVIRGTGNHSVLPRNVDIVDNDISSVLANPGTSPLGVGFGVEADGTNYLVRDNTIDDVNIGAEVKEAATELTFVDNSLSNIDTSVSGLELYFGEKDGDAVSPVASIIADNTFDQAVGSGGGDYSYDQTIQPAP
ncbi:SipW-dependent-type signal peptide-containing protein [Haloglomus halophilum]|uniref:SipW-dependent-type signal peptide-containing protein n=1 Tax=Haloglomus halophilum TaxID=2962672 RepID=UPI0020C9F90A|nr:SipW-dependent-type signal peptide-containing protein [Haloglomus halophilum]